MQWTMRTCGLLWPHSHQGSTTVPTGVLHCRSSLLQGAARDLVGIWCGAISGNMKVSFQAARSIG